MIAELLTRQLCVMFMMMFVGIVIVKTKLLTPEQSKPLSVVSLWVVAPCALLSAFQIDYTPAVRDGFMLACIAAVLAHIILIGSVGVFSKFLRFNQVERANLLYSNSANLIFPIVLAIMGPEWVIYSSGFLAVQLFLLWSHCLSLVSGRPLLNFRSIYTNSNMIAVFVGVICLSLGIKFPPLIQSVINPFAATLGPISMLVLGILLATAPWKTILTTPRIYILVLFKMIILPGIVLLFMKYSGLDAIAPDGKLVLLTTMLAVSAPSAVIISQMAQLYGHDAAYSSAINVATTVVCVATMPLMIHLYAL